MLYNLDKARAPAHEAGEIIAVEGYMDTIALHRAGVGHVVAPLGTALTSDQLALLWRIAPSPTLCFDGDQAGLKAAYRALDMALPLLRPGHSLKFALLPEGLDPDDLLKAEGPEAVKTVIAEARPLADLLWSREAEQARIDTPDGRAAFEIRLSSLVREIGDETVRRYYGEDLKARLSRHLAPQGGPSLRAFGRGRSRYVPAKPLIQARRGPRARPLPHDYSAPPSEGLRASPLAQRSTLHEQERRERLLLLGIVNHPELLHDFLDDYAAAEFTSRELDSLKRQIIDMAALAEGLDGSSIKDHLNDQGFGPILARLESQAARLNEWFLNPGAASADARTALRQMFALHRKSVTLDRELKAAEAQFAADPTEEKLIALNQIREELASHAGMEAHIDGFGEASGRDAPAL